MSEKPVITDDPLYQLLRHGKIDEFNTLKQGGEAVRLNGTDLRGLDLRGLDAGGIDLTNAYMRQTDLRGIDLSTANLEGASIHAAKISGVYFPHELDPEEITLSLVHGTRLRYRR